MESLEFCSGDKSVRVRLEFIEVNRLRVTYAGKSWPKHTQCLIFINDVLESFGTVVKHYKDEEDPNFARLACSKKAVRNSKLSKHLREFIMKHIENELG